jgi:hypothetical protein
VCTCLQNIIVNPDRGPWVAAARKVMSPQPSAKKNPHCGKYASLQVQIRNSLSSSSSAPAVACEHFSYDMQSADRQAGAAFTKCFHNFSTIIPYKILLQANPDAPNSYTQERIVEKL